MLIADIVEDDRDFLFELVEKGTEDFPHLRMGGIGCSYFEEMPPLPEIHCHDKLCFQGIGKNAPGLLRGGAEFDKSHVQLFRHFH